MINPVQQAVTLRRAGQTAAAEELLRKHLRHAPNDPLAHRLLALCLCDLSRIDQAVFHAQRAVDLAPTYADAPVTLGNALTFAGRFEKAIAAYRAGLALQPANANAGVGLGGALIKLERFDEAEAALLGLISANPDSAPLRRVLARAYEGAGRIEEAIAAQRQTLARTPDDARTLTSLCFTMQASDVQTPEQIAGAHRDFGRVVTARVAKLAPTLGWSTPNAFGPDRPLRIGYVSPDFREHSVAHFIEPVLRQHDRAAFTPVCFHTGSTSDEVTGRLASIAELHEIPTNAAGAEIPSPGEVALARRIVDARIDVLVDLAGHTGGAMLGTMALRSAPLQLTYLGYPDTTGLTQVQARIVDAITDPAGPEIDARCTERLVRLPRCFLTYQPRDNAPDVAPPPFASDAGGVVTFGSFNNIKKLSPACLDLWARVLADVPASRLLIKGKFASEVTRGRFRAAFASRGVGEDRVGFLAYTESVREHLELYARVDIALDSLPYSGTTTTCEALWQGVPVITLRGVRHASRVGASLLTSVGLGELTADDAAGFVRIAKELAGDRPRLSALRSTLRDRLRASPLLDAAGFTRELESALRGLWRDACKS